MQSNEQLINDFYTAFRQKNAAGMNACYSDGIVFYDPVFELLENPAYRNAAKDVQHTLLTAGGNDRAVELLENFVQQSTLVPV